MIENFTYNDIVLYSKGWYQRSENICDDLGYLISQVYAYYPTKEDEVSMYMLIVLDRLYEELENDGQDASINGRWYRSHRMFEQEIRHRMHLYEWSRDMAIISLVLCILQGLSKDEIELKKPVYGKKCHFRMGQLFGGKFPVSMTYTTMNKIADKAFNKK